MGLGRGTDITLRVVNVLIIVEVITLRVVKVSPMGPGPVSVINVTNVIPGQSRHFLSKPSRTWALWPVFLLRGTNREVKSNNTATRRGLN